MNNREVAKLTDKYVANTYKRYPIALVRGKGARVWDADGKEYLDFLAGIAVNAVLPSTMDTEANRAAMPDADRSAWVPVEAVADAIATLARPESAHISGTLLAI